MTEKGFVLWICKKYEMTQQKEKKNFCTCDKCACAKNKARQIGQHIFVIS